MLIPSLSVSEVITHTERRHLFQINHSSTVFDINRKTDTGSGSRPHCIYVIRLYPYFLSPLQLLRVKNAVKAHPSWVTMILPNRANNLSLNAKIIIRLFFFLLIPHSTKAGCPAVAKFRSPHEGIRQHHQSTVLWTCSVVLLNLRNSRRSLFSVTKENVSVQVKNTLTQLSINKWLSSTKRDL